MKLFTYYNPNIILICILLFSCNFLYGQTKQENYIKKATLLSTACPGLGQYYNKKYWKIPVIYTALGATVYYYWNNNKLFSQYKDYYIAEIDDNKNTVNHSSYNASQLITLQDYYRDSRDLSILLFILMYSLNIIDACVDAHFTNYNISDDLSLYLKPTTINNNEQIILTLKLNL